MTHQGLSKLTLFQLTSVPPFVGSRNGCWTKHLPKSTELSISGISRISGAKHNRLSTFTLSPTKRASNRTARVQVSASSAEPAETTTERVPGGGVSQDGMGVALFDPMLQEHAGHLKYRFAKYKELKGAIDKHEGGLAAFSKGYERMGFTREEGAVVYREWAPAAISAQLIGDFNAWNGGSSHMSKDKFGVWSIRLPDVEGKHAIPHGSRVKIRLQKGDGHWVDRIPAWIKFATVEPGKMGAAYDGVFWDPPKAEKHTFAHPSPPPPLAPRIYEAHVGMSGEEQRVSTYREFADNVLPRIKSNGYNTIQLMAVPEHSYYASFGYHVTNFFAVSSRCGTPEDFKFLIDTAHGLGIRVLLDVVHSHASSNQADGLAGFDFGQDESSNYFRSGAAGHHPQWGSRCFSYANWEVLRLLLSNLRWWIEEYKVDGFRFDGVTSMLYHHHGANRAFSGNYREYFSTDTDVDAVVYLMLANDLLHTLPPPSRYPPFSSSSSFNSFFSPSLTPSSSTSSLSPAVSSASPSSSPSPSSHITTIAEDVSGMPTLGLPVSIGGIGFDYRLAMAIPDRWIELLKDHPDESSWSMGDLVGTLTNRRYTEKCIGYAESHDQSIVGDKSFAFLIMDSDMYFSMSVFQHPPAPRVERGVALHKMIHLLTMALGGDGFLIFMGAEFGHPEWVDFPREENGWSYERCRRIWSLVDTDHLQFKYMNAFNRAMNELDDRWAFLSSQHQIVSSTNEMDKVIVFERGPLLFVFNFHPTKTYEGYKVGCPEPGKFRVALDSDAEEFGGRGRVGADVDHFSSPEGVPGKPETNFNNRCASIKVLSPPRSCQVYFNADMVP